MADSQALTETLLEKAFSVGASLAGIADARAVAQSPSYQRSAPCRHLLDAGSVVVLALHHPDDARYLDWWDNVKGGTPGNRTLMRISRELSAWYKKDCGEKAIPLPYQEKQGGIFLKDAAVQAGLGVIGENNLLITPQYGPRVRLRALLLPQTLLPTGPIDFDPCTGCAEPCRRACPRQAFGNGWYAREACAVQMKEDEDSKIYLEVPGAGTPPRPCIRYCRRCELACPVGKQDYRYSSFS